MDICITMEFDWPGAVQYSAKTNPAASRDALTSGYLSGRNPPSSSEVHLHGKDSPNHSLVCRRCSEGTFFGLYHKPELDTEVVGGHQVKGYRYRPGAGFKPTGYEVPWYRLDRYNSYGNGHNSNHSSKEILVTGDVDTRRQVLTVKNAGQVYHRDGPRSLPTDYQSPNNYNLDIERKSTQASTRSGSPSFPSALHSPKLVKEVLKKMSTVPSGWALSPPSSYKPQLHKESGLSNRLSERTIPVQKKAPLNKDTTSTRKSNIHQPTTMKAKTSNSDQELQSDNLIEEIVALDLRTETENIEATYRENGRGSSTIERSSKIVNYPAPPKPPRNFDSLPRGFKLSASDQNDIVLSGIRPLSSRSSKEMALVPADATSSTDSTCMLQHQQRQSYLVVVAIDFGTTYSGYAFSFTRDPDNVHTMRKWEGGDPGVINQKTPTTVLLTPDEKFHSFGYAARDNYHDLDQQEAKRWLYFDRFKMTLYATKNLGRDTKLMAANGQLIKAMSVFAHALRYFKELALQELSDQSATEFLNDDIRWVVTVPAIWRQPAKQFMRIAAYEAGLASAQCPEQLTIALEPEAASIYCRRLQVHQLVPQSAVFGAQRLSLPASFEQDKSRQERGGTELAFVGTKGTRYMVVDCGGGTVDITVHEIWNEKGCIRELHRATGGPHGSVGVDLEFERLLGDIFGVDFVEQFRGKRPAAFVDLMVAFEARKRNASPYKITPLNISLPFSFIDYYRKLKNSSVEVAIKKFGNKEIKWSSQGMLRLEPSCMQKLFQPTLEAIIRNISAVLEHPGVKDISYLFLVGGFSESPILQKHVRDSFSGRLKVIVPQGVSLAILKGAVIFGLDPTVVSSRRSKLTYGVGVLNRFQHGVHPQDKLVVKDGVEWCADVFDKFVLPDQSLCVGDAIIRKYTPARASQACSVINIYCSERDDAQFVTDAGVRRCGTLVLDLSEESTVNQDGGSVREIQTVMTFGDTELKVSAIDVATGKCVKVDVDFFDG